MATIVILSHRYIENYDFDAVINSHDRLVAIVLKSYVEFFPKSKMKYFSKIYTIPEPDNNVGPLINFSYDCVKEILTEELVYCPHKSEFKLICIDEVNMIMAAKLRDELGIVGPGEKDILKFQDKLCMKSALKNSSVLMPKFMEFNSSLAINSTEKYFKQLCSTLGEKFVLKPTRYTGSYGVFVISCFSDFINFLAMDLYHQYVYEAEEYINGDLYHCDVVLSEREITFMKCCKYSCPNLDFTNGKIIASLLVPEKTELNRKISEKASIVLNSLNAKNGSYHIELFYNIFYDDFIFLEVAARPSGGLVALMYEKTTGLNLFTLDLAAHMNRIAKPRKKISKYSLQALVPLDSKTIMNFKNVKFKSEKNIEWLIDTKDTSVALKSNSVIDTAAKLLLTSNDYSYILNDFEQLTNC